MRCPLWLVVPVGCVAYLAVGWWVIAGVNWIDEWAGSTSTLGQESHHRPIGKAGVLFWPCVIPWAVLFGLGFLVIVILAPFVWVGGKVSERAKRRAPRPKKERSRFGEWMARGPQLRAR